MLVAQSCHPRRDDTALHGPTAQTTDQPGTTRVHVQRTLVVRGSSQEAGTWILNFAVYSGAQTAVGLGVHL